MSFDSGTSADASDESSIPPEETVRCQCPNMNFANGTELRQHMIDEHNVGDLGPRKKFVCPECNNSSLKLGRMVKHWEKVHKKIRNFACPRCPQLFRTHMKVVKHCENDHGYRARPPKENLFSCNVCKLKFPLHSELLNHVRKNHGQEKRDNFMFACSNCPNLAFKKSTELINHSRGQHGYKTRSMMYEDILEKNMVQLEIQKRQRGVQEWSQNIEGKLFTCGVCGLDFFLHSELKCHAKHNHKEKGTLMLFACSKCQLPAFIKMSKLHKHAKTEHGYKARLMKESLASVNQSNSTPEGHANTGKYFSCHVPRAFNRIYLPSISIRVRHKIQYSNN